MECGDGQMSLSPAVLDAMLAAGCTADQIVATVKAAMIAEQYDVEARRAERREGNAERQARFRERRKEGKTVCNKSNALRGVTPPIDNTHTPSVSPNGETDRPVAFPKPDWADAAVWPDFLANRKRKRLPNTATAHKAFLADIARIADAEWPPGRLLEHATAKGWGAIYDPRQQLKSNGTADAKPSPSNDEGPRNPYVRAAVARQAARAGHVVGQPDCWP